MDRKTYQPLTISKVKWDAEILTQSEGRLVAQPLEPGFGLTFGNALRRVLLGGIEGAAVTSVIIKGVNNEFSVLPGVIEDAMQVILNIKEIVVRNKTGEPGVMRLSVNGESVATVKDIVADDHLELLNQDHMIAHVAKNGSLEIEFFVEGGRGYRPAKWPVGQMLQPDGKIYLDAVFAPVRKVSYDVFKTRVGDTIDYDKLVLSVETDGTISPVDAVNYAVSVLRTQLEHFLSVQEIPFNAISKVAEEAQSVTRHEKGEVLVGGLPVDLLLKPIDALEFSVRAHNCLINAGVARIIDLVNMSEDALQKTKNFGKKSFDEVKEGLKQHGLSLDMNIQEADLLAIKDKAKE
ncbi:MAG: DNA-directed RNA polymerase subunit alpha [candidate division TM6 bacterium GW2011_GWF2_43_17]|nr:MAG: DNA-directed RNA polymerase subunit alpha [candidate division TM6 bacterium GW2011_GWF2_43_17]HAU30117.1 DNA-directed RNA polymerase subunit alpha [Candidatus Dependentiae bacterium]